MKRTYMLVSDAVRNNACRDIMQAPDNYQVVISQKTRTLDQNALMWVRLGEISRRIKWHGQFLTPENWKDIFTAALKRQAVVPGIDGGFVVLGTSTRNMTKGEMGELMDLMAAFEAEQAA